eukprot:2102133-Alexandrium_andersonii.AAC.1
MASHAGSFQGWRDVDCRRFGADLVAAVGRWRSVERFRVFLRRATWAPGFSIEADRLLRVVAAAAVDIRLRGANGDAAGAIALSGPATVGAVALVAVGARLTPGAPTLKVSGAGAIGKNGVA